MIDIKKRRAVEDIANDWLDAVKGFLDRPCRPWAEIGKGRKHFSSYSEKLKYQCLKAVFEYTRDKRLRKACLAKLEQWWRHLDNIILASPQDMELQVAKWDKRKNAETRLLKQLQPVLVSYYESVSKVRGRWLVDELNIKTCPYCNRQFIHTFKGRAFERPELDHFYPKADYPLFCLSFYNLIPACHSCNHVKLETQIGLNPYKRAFRRPFVICDKRGRKLSKSQIFKLKKSDLMLKFDGRDEDEEKNVEILGLEDVYNKHQDYVKELIDKSMAYDKYARQSLVTSFQGAGFHPSQVYEFVWGRHLMDAEYEDRPLSKLTKDILDLLEIRR